VVQAPKTPVRNTLFRKHFCEAGSSHKITRASEVETFNCSRPLPPSSNPPYATFLFLSAAQAKYRSFVGAMPSRKRPDNLRMLRVVVALLEGFDPLEMSIRFVSLIEDDQHH
jgi:hypothetical protein